jgi:hypothetical protein
MASCLGMKPGIGVIMVRVSFFFNILTILCVCQLQGTVLAATILTRLSNSRCRRKHPLVALNSSRINRASPSLSYNIPRCNLLDDSFYRVD